MFTREQIEEIKTLDQGRMEYHFSTVLGSSFKRGSSTQADARLYQIYEEATGKHLNLNGCKMCQFNNYKEIANYYNKSKDYWENQEEENAGNEIVDMIENMANLEKEVVNKPSKNNKPKGRPKKKKE